MGIVKAQSVTKGKGVKVCVVDSGVDPAVPELAGVTFAGGRDFSGQGDTGGLAPVGSSHGTGVAAYLAGRGNGDGGGMLGVAPEVTVMSMSTAQGQLSSVSVRSTLVAIKACADAGAQVINLSVALSTSARDIADAVAYAQARDAVVVVGAGNDGVPEMSGLATRFGVLTVAGVDQSLQADPLSSFGGYVQEFAGEPQMVRDGQGVAVVGPSSISGGGSAACVGVWRPETGGYKQSCGTSFAAPVISGVAALVRAAHPELNAANVVNRIVKTAKPPADGSAVPSPHYGFGLVDAYAAVTADVPVVKDNPLGSQYTESMGVWNPAMKPKRAEPVAGAKVAPGELKDAVPVTTDSQETASGLPSWLLLVGAALVLPVVLGVVVALLVSRRSRSARSSAHPGQPPPGGWAGTS